jgi:hypothetical protein
MPQIASPIFYPIDPVSVTLPPCHHYCSFSLTPFLLYFLVTSAWDHACTPSIEITSDFPPSLCDWLGCPQAAQAAATPPTATGPAGHLLGRHHLLLEPGRRRRWRQPSPPPYWPAAPPPEIPRRKLQRQHRRRLRLLHGERLLRLGNAQQPSDDGGRRRSNGGGVLYDVIGGGGDLYDVIGGGGDLYDVIDGGWRRVHFPAIGTSAMGSE